MDVLMEFQDKFKVSELTIYETDYWVWSLRPHQSTIGAGILSVKRERKTFDELSPEEFADLGNIIKVIEPTLRRGFNYDVINYLMLMMFDRHVHYHIFPRYKNSVKALGESWKDHNWPGVPALSGDKLSDVRLQEIVSYIKSNLMCTSQGDK